MEPNMNSSAARPPVSVAILLNASSLLMRNRWSSSTCIVYPNAPEVLGTMVILCTGAEWLWQAATSACPTSW